MSVTVLYFATAKDAVGGIAKETIKLPSNQPMSITDLLSVISAKYPTLDPVLKSAMIAVNLEYVDITRRPHDAAAEAVALKSGDEVAIIPPVSGG
ncbi:hypothetical protein SeMB42_g06241 [Synchytrium endobioticum]|uniref:Molybdopterin synthase sulfur carrier subunit n=1 Tax=Synchytrium endobioticum TaxID=286115 RepID=A0A507D222_9FUNG|nr:hypothetical protein SeMB42_g06241 [Synchytrium endobioticum]TPX45300.1 hypothetical protein SeLEV6574_g03937 [Synchytrium endobioticum]